MRQFIPIFLLSLFVVGCATYKGAGSRYWYDDRMAEIEDSYGRGRISETEYLKLKNDTDRIRQDYLIRNDYYYPYYYSVHYSFPRYHHRQHHRRYHHY